MRDWFTDLPRCWVDLSSWLLPASSPSSLGTEMLNRLSFRSESNAAEAFLLNPFTLSRIYPITASLYHRPSFMMVVLSTPCKCKSIANELLMECVPTASFVMLKLSSPICGTALRRVSRTCFELTCEYVLLTRTRFTGDSVEPRGSLGCGC